MRGRTRCPSSRGSCPSTPRAFLASGWHHRSGCLISLSYNHLVSNKVAPGREIRRTSWSNRRNLCTLASVKPLFRWRLLIPAWTTHSLISRSHSISKRRSSRRVSEPSPTSLYMMFSYISPPTSALNTLSSLVMVLQPSSVPEAK